MSEANADPTTEAALFDIEAGPPVSLADKFVFPPMSVLDRRSGAWQDRKRAWKSLGIKSELGREGQLLYSGADVHVDYQGGTSIFDPVVAELVYRWFSATGSRVLDPFAGGSVRGVVASTLGRHYLGVDLSGDQVAANREQAHLGSEIIPQWIEGDSASLDQIVPGHESDLVFSCPPYADLEVYSDDPRDLSVMGYPDFLSAYRTAIAQSVDTLHGDRFAAWVISDVRDKRTGAYRGLVADTIRAFVDCGMLLHNEAIILDQIGTSALRAERPFMSTRKMTRTHQHLLVFVKGSAARAAAYCKGAQS